MIDVWLFISLFSSVQKYSIQKCKLRFHLAASYRKKKQSHRWNAERHLCARVFFKHTAFSTTVTMEMNGAGPQPGEETACLWQTISETTLPHSYLEAGKELFLLFIWTDLFIFENVKYLTGPDHRLPLNIDPFLFSASPRSQANTCLQVVLVTFVFLCVHFKSRVDVEAPSSSDWC